MAERKPVDEMLEWLGVDIDTSAIEDKECLNWNEEYCKLYDDAEYYGRYYLGALHNWRYEWYAIIYNWDKSRIRDRRHFECVLRDAKWRHSEAKFWKPEFINSRNKFAQFVAQQNTEWLEAI